MRYIYDKPEDTAQCAGFGMEYSVDAAACPNVDFNTVSGHSDPLEQKYVQMGGQINAIDYWANNAFSPDTYRLNYEVETAKGDFVMYYGENVIRYNERIVTKREQNNFKGGLTHTSKIKDKPVEICDPIYFTDAYRYQREDKPGKHYFNVYSSVDSSGQLSTEAKVIEEATLNSPQLSKVFKPDIVRTGQEKLCSILFRTEIYRLSKRSLEIMIPCRPGWYFDQKYGWVFLERCRYEKIPEYNLPPLMCKRLIGKTERSVNDVCSELESMIGTNVHQPVNERLIEDIKLNPNKYAFIFTNTANLKILNYLADCNKLDSIPYKSEYDLIERIDGDKLTPAGYILDEEQFKSIVKSFRKRFESEYQRRKVTQLCLNLLSVNTKRGLYVLAYRRLELDVKSRTLRPSEDITICKEFTIAGEKESIRQFLDADDYYLLEDFEKYAEMIKDRITASNSQINGVDDMPYFICIESEHLVDLSIEYREILNMYDEDRVTIPIKAFFGDLTAPSRRRKDYPITLLNNKINLDQLLAIHNSLKYPVVYVQGPPGTGKSNTIVNTIISAFFNEKTVLFSSYNNHPIDGVFDVLRGMKYRERIIPFPILRLGSNKKVEEAIERIKGLFDYAKTLNIYESTLNKNKSDKTEQTKKLTELLKKHEERIELKERRDAISDLYKLNDNMNFQTDLEQRQLYQVQQRMKEIGTVTDEDALSLLTDDQEAFRKYLFYTSAMYIKRLEEPKYADFMKILDVTNKEERINEFNRWVSDDDNLRKLQRVFPVIATTCISAHKLGKPAQYFDMVIMDEASQCNTAMSLVPIIRGNNLLLVGDPQQLNPVVLLDKTVNESLRKKYNVAPEYDYIANSVYKTFLACDSVSDEILLRYHYRCDKKIIEFNNKKYYNCRLKIKTDEKAETPLVFSDIQYNTTDYKNTAPAEADKIVQFIKMNKDKSIGIITPFTNQRDCIQKALHEAKLDNVTCGTVHAFQGDEKDIILFSLALTDKTNPKTYDWLKNNRELVNVAVSRAKEQLIVLSSKKELERLHDPDQPDDIFELVNYVASNGRTEVTPKDVSSRALGIKPYSTETEEAFLQNLNHALDNILLNEGRCSVEREVAISQVFMDNPSCSDLFYTGRFDFVIYQRDYGNRKMPVLAIELDGKEHIESEIVRERDRKKNKICRDHGFELIRVENSYARRYNFIKSVLIEYFGKRSR